MFIDSVLNGIRRRVLNIPTFLLNNIEYVFALYLYILLTILFTWPLILNFTTFVNGNVQDIFHELWYLHLGSTAKYGPFFLFYTTSVWYPTGVALYFQVTSPFNTLVFMALSPIIGEIASYNFLVMFSLFASGFFMFVLVKYLTGNVYAAFFAGLAYAFAPFHLSQELSHLNIMSSEFLPLYGYFLVRLLRENRMRNSLFAGTALVLNAMCDLHFLLLSLAMTVVFLVYFVLAQRRDIINKRFLMRFFTMNLFAGLLIILMYFQTFYALLFIPQGSGLTSPQEAFITARSADLLSFILPSPENPLFRAFTYHIFLSISPIRTVPIATGREFVSFTVFAMALAGIVAFRKRREIWLWVLVAFAGFLVSLGPFIRVGGKVTPIAGVWNWLYFIIPFFSSFRAPERFDYLVGLGLAILAGYGVTSLLSSITKKDTSRRKSLVKKYIVVAVLCLLVIVEFIQVPNVETNAQIPQVYQVLAADHSNYTVLEVPVYRGYSVYLYYQSLYNHPLINGGVPRTPQYPLSFEEATPFINQLGQYAPGHEPQPDIINQSILATQVAPYILAQYHIKYIIIHKNLFLNATAYIPYADLVSSVVGNPFYQDANIVAFRYVPPANTTIMQFVESHQANTTIFSMLTGEWYSFDFFGIQARAMQVFAGLNLYSSTNQQIQLAFRMRGLFSNYPLELSVNGRTVGTYLALNGTDTTYFTPFFPVQQGVNQIQFYSLGGCATPPTRSSVSILIQSAQRSIACVSASFSWIDPITMPQNLQA